MAAEKKRVAIVGAGPSGLTACKQLLARGFRPVIFDAGTAAGGVWRHTLASTRLQTPAAPYRFSDFPWPDEVVQAKVYPRHDQVADYMTAYAERFGVLECIRFGCKVVEASYVGATEEEVAKWEQWSGNGEAFGDGTGEWHLTVEHDGGDSESASTQVHKFDFLILCVGRYHVPKLPTFPDGQGPEVFHGKVLHSLDYSKMLDADAADVVRDKRVVVVGAGKSALDLAAECAEANGPKYPCTLVHRSAYWMRDPQLDAKFSWLIGTRLAELMVHKPGEGLILSLIATILSPLRWLLFWSVEFYFKKLLPVDKHGMVPDHSFSGAYDFSWQTGTLPHGFYNKVEEGSIELKKCSSFSFNADGVVLDGDHGRVTVPADVVILATGYDSDAPLKRVLASPRFRDIIVGSPDMLPLYRHCVHPRIPQLAMVGYIASAASIYPYEMMAKWVARLLDGTVRLPGVKAMERDVAEWERWVRQGSAGGAILKSCINSVTTWYHDQLCRDMGHNPKRKNGFLAELLQPYGSTDYAGMH